jgi:hypothetical protein
MKSNRKPRSISVRRTKSQDEPRKTYKSFTCPDTAAICGELAEELEATGFEGTDCLDGCAKALPWLFLMSVVQSLPKS